MALRRAAVIGYHFCTMSCGICSNQYLSFSAIEGSVIAECWNGHTSDGDLDPGEQEKMNDSVCPVCNKDFKEPKSGEQT